MPHRPGASLLKTYWWPAALVALLVAAVLLTKGPPAPASNPPGAFSFAALGDAPYYAWEHVQYRLALDDLDAHDLSLVLHVGDILWRPCSETRYRQALDEFNGLRHPVVYTPGDNEWTDCWQPQVGGDQPLDRLARLRQVFFAQPSRSLGGRRLAVASQAENPEFEEFVEHARWSTRDVVFATVHLVGSRNAREPFPGRTTVDDDASVRRTAAATAWLRETFAQAEARAAPAVVVAFHASPGFEAPPADRYRRNYEPFLETLEELAERFARPVLLVHGDDHEFRVDRPLTRRTTGVGLDNVMRLQVPGSPDVGWVRVVVTPGEAQPFGFEARVVPAWKYW